MIGWRIKLNAFLERIGLSGDRMLLLLSIVVGAATGLGAHLFYELLEFAFEATFSKGGLFRQSHVMLIIVPMLGALMCGLITQFFSSEARGHGVPEVMDAMYRKGGTIRPRVALAKSVASVLTIGSGGSAGTEGPIVQIGAAIGSSVGQALGMQRHHMNTLVACGVAAGIAAIFNAPIAGVLFALEIFLRDFSFKTFSPIVFASVISTSITHALRPDDGGIFEVASPEIYIFNGFELPNYLVLGVLCALGALAFIRLLYAAEDIAERLRVPDWTKPVAGAAILGLLGFGMATYADNSGAPIFYGNGYPLIRLAISAEALSTLGLWTLILGAVLKIVATTLTLGSGGSGGIFAPSLFVGACIGGAFGIALHRIGYVPASSVSAYAIVGMAAVVAGTTHAPLTAIVMLYELTREPKVILPIMFAAIVATGLASYLFRESIYTLKLTRRGVRIGRIADLTILKRLQADQVRVVTAPIVHPGDPMQKLLDLAGQAEANDFVVVDDDGEYVGMVIADDIKTALLQPEAVPLLLVDELARSGVPSVRPNETLDVVMDKFSRARVSSLPMLAASGDRHVQGLITRQAVMDGYYQELDRLS
jgi:CIC family chloride channel protein